MTLDETLAELEAMGTEQNRKIYRRHGARGPLYGVSYANFYLLKKRIKCDQALAEGLWDSGIEDARVLATMIADPAAMDRPLIERWARDADNYGLTDAVVGLAARTSEARPLAEAWMDEDTEYVQRAGWGLLGQLALHDESLPDGYFAPYLARIQATIHAQANRVRQAMNNALIAIGGRNEALESAAVAVARAIGPVYVDHGETDCKTPDAEAYIRKMHDRRRAKERVAPPA